MTVGAHWQLRSPIWRRYPLVVMPCISLAVLCSAVGPFVVGAPWPLPLCVLNAFIWLALHHAIHVGAHGLTIEKVCMLVWPAGIGPHVCLVSYPSKCASCLCLAHGPGPVQVFPPPPCHTRATARGEDPKTWLMTNSQGQGPQYPGLFASVVVWLVGFFWINSQGRDPRTRRGSRPPAAV